jgi:hypothetical protein
MLKCQSPSPVLPGGDHIEAQARETHHPANGPTDSVCLKLAVKPACDLIDLLREQMERP